MNTIKALIIATLALTILVSANASSPAKNTEQSFIIRVTSSQDQTIDGSYLAITRNDSNLVHIHQQTPFEIKVQAKTINAIFRTESQNKFLKVQLLQQGKDKDTPIVEGKGHAIILNSHSNECKNAFIVTR